MASQKTKKELSKKNPYWISKHRRLELEHFCLQYPEWQERLNDICVKGSQDEWSDPTSDEAIKRFYYERSMRIVEEASREAGEDIAEFILKAVTEDRSFPNLSSYYDMPCGRDYYYERFRKFWYILSQKKHFF